MSHLGNIQDPRIIVHIAHPEVSRSLAGEQTRTYYAKSRTYRGKFASAANKIATSRFPYESVVFEVPGYGFEPTPQHVALSVTWSVKESGRHFEVPNPMNFADPSARLSVPGITVEATMHFAIPGRTQPFEFTATTSPEAFKYQAFMGMPAADDLFKGMTEMAFENIVAQLWP